MNPEGFMTMAEIESAFPSEWVLIDEPRTNAHLEVEGGKVLFHSADLNEVYGRAEVLRPTRFSLLFTGRPPSDMVMVL